MLPLHVTGENADKLLQFKRWFWSIVEKMSMTERQDLVSLLSALFLAHIHRKKPDVLKFLIHTLVQ